MNALDHSDQARYLQFPDALFALLVNALSITPTGADHLRPPARDRTGQVRSGHCSGIHPLVESRGSGQVGEA